MRALVVATALVVLAASDATAGGPAGQLQPPRDEAVPPRSGAPQPGPGRPDWYFGPPPSPGRPAARPPVQPAPPIPGPLALPAPALFVPGQVLVALAGAATPDTARALALAYGLRVVETFPLTSVGVLAALFEIAGDVPVPDIVDAVGRDPRVVLAQPNYRHRSMGAEGERAAPQYALARIHADAAHRVATGAGVTVALIDTGVDERHPALAGRVARQIDVLHERRPEPAAHGTALAGVLVAEGPMRGVAPGARLLAIRAFRADPARPGEAIGESAAVARAVDLAIREGVHVVNLSFGGPKEPLLTLLVRAATASGIAVVAAAGNGGPSGPPVYPAALESVVAVTATDHADQLYPAATPGAYITVAAPGVEVFAPGPGSGYRFVSGTSVAAAHVAGVVALLLETRPRLAPDRIKALLETTAVDLGEPGRDPAYGAGRIDALKAVEAVGALAASHP